MDAKTVGGDKGGVTLKAARTFDADEHDLPDEIREAIADQWAGNEGGAYYPLEMRVPPARGYSNASKLICAYLLSHGAVEGETILIKVWG